MWFFETPPFFHWFFANVNGSPVLFGFLVTWDVTFGGITHGPRRTASYVRSTVDRSRVCAPLTKKNSMRFVFFRAFAFLAQKTEKLWGFLAVYTVQQNPQFFFILVFANVNGPYVTMLLLLKTESKPFSTAPALHKYTILKNIVLRFWHCLRNKIP